MFLWKKATWAWMCLVHCLQNQGSMGIHSFIAAQSWIVVELTAMQHRGLVWVASIGIVVSVSSVSVLHCCLRKDKLRYHHSVCFKKQMASLWVFPISFCQPLKASALSPSPKALSSFPTFPCPLLQNSPVSLSHYPNIYPPFLWNQLIFHNLLVGICCERDAIGPSIMDEVVTTLF